MSSRVVRGFAAFGTFALLAVFASSTLAQPAPVPVRLVQGSDGALYVVQGGNSWTVVPDQISDSVVAALSPTGEIDGTFPNQLFVVQASASAPSAAPQPPAAAPAPVPAPTATSVPVPQIGFVGHALSLVIEYPKAGQIAAGTGRVAIPTVASEGSQFADIQGAGVQANIVVTNETIQFTGFSRGTALPGDPAGGFNGWVITVGPDAPAIKSAELTTFQAWGTPPVVSVGTAAGAAKPNEVRINAAGSSVTPTSTATVVVTFGT